MQEQAELILERVRQCLEQYVCRTLEKTLGVEYMRLQLRKFVRSHDGRMTFSEARALVQQCYRSVFSETLLSDATSESKEKATASEKALDRLVRFERDGVACGIDEAQFAQMRKDCTNLLVLIRRDDVVLELERLLAHPEPVQNERPRSHPQPQPKGQQPRQSAATQADASPNACAYDRITQPFDDSAMEVEMLCQSHEADALFSSSAVHGLTTEIAPLARDGGLNGTGSRRLADLHVAALIQSWRQNPRAKGLVVLDGPNLAWRHGLNEYFSWRGIVLALTSFVNHGFSCVAFVPESRTSSTTLPEEMDRKVVQSLVEAGLVVAVPSDDYDDAYAIQYARNNAGVIMSNDKFGDFLYQARSEYERTLLSEWFKNCRWSFLWRVDELIPNPLFEFNRAFEYSARALAQCVNGMEAVTLPQR